MSDTGEKLAYLMLNLAANHEQEEKLVDTAIDALIEYRNLGFLEKKRPVTELLILSTKWSQKDKKVDINSIINDADKFGAARDIIEKMHSTN